MPARLATLDAVRGFAVMGILLLNIVDFAMPSYAYVDPHFYGGAEGANWAVWAVNYVLADGKMRGLFTMLFGASTVLVAEQAVRSGESPVRVHYARIAALFVFGMIHAYLIWSGDILVLYSVVGAVAFLAWRWRTQTLLAVGALLLAFNLLGGLIDYAAVAKFEAAATAPDASPTLRRQWRDYLVAQADSVAARDTELAAYRGNYATALPVRAETALYMQTAVNTQMLPDTTALMLIGMALFRLGFFSGAWSRRSYWRFALFGYAICLPLYAPLVWWLDATRFSPVTLVATEAIHLSLLRPWLSLAHAAMVILFVQSGMWRWLAARLAATGRLAFSNYIGTSIICTLIFNGYGLGWFGYLERWQCYPIVLGVWAIMLLWSKPWLDRFAYGPLEWLWRSVARWRWQPLRRAA